jgi:enoyl-CoA hydratase/carnithine racemase
MSAQPDVVLVEQHEHVRIIRLNRPEKKNALSDELGWAIVREVERAAHDDDVWGVGLTGEVVVADDFDKRLLEYCAQLAAVSPIAARQTKQMVIQGLLQSDLRAHCRDEIAKARRGLATEDSKEAVKAIMEKRPPVFRGR